jgi:hypothetical protein
MLSVSLIALIRASTFLSTNSLIAFPCSIMTFAIASTSVSYVFVRKSVNFSDVEKLFGNLTFQ